MFEAAEVGNRIDDKAFNKEVPKIREALLKAQRQLACSDQRLIIVVGGVKKAGRGETVNTLLEWMDARGVETHAIWEPTDEERERPEFWRFWRLIPPKGRAAIFYGSWYTRPIIDRAFGDISRAELDQAMDRIVEFEKMLTNENTKLVKLWLHLSKKAQKNRMKALEKNSTTKWRVTKEDWAFAKRYDRFREICEYALRRTHSPATPWHIIEATDENYRTLASARVLNQTLEAPVPTPEPRQPDRPKPAAVNVISALDMSVKMSKEEYAKKAPKLQAELAKLARDLYYEQRSLILVFEGPDAAGKGGAIRRITHALDARSYKVIAVAAPTDEERSRPYLWRFWRHLPRRGQITIYDRSWYGRVLVERLEGYCAPSDWKRAYTEINDFEEQLTDFGTIVLKFWLAITPEEQLERFKDREETPYKQYKIGPDDWRNREKWDAYVAAACDMIEKTGTAAAPWVLIEANDKDHARYKVLKTVVKTLEKSL